MIHTFVICAYRQSRYLEACILSCLAQNSYQTGQSQVIIYTSTPNEWIKKLADKYQLELFVLAGGGIGNDWNNALSVVKTDYATIAHQDDVYLPTYGTEVIQAFNHEPKRNIVFTDYAENDATGAVRPRNLNLKIKSAALKVMSLSNHKGYQRRIYAFGNFISCPAVSFNLKRLSAFRFDGELKMTVDWDAWERIMQLDGTIHYVNQILMYHRIHQDSETTANTANKHREIEEYEMYERYWGKTIAKLLMKVYVNNQKTNQ